MSDGMLGHWPFLVNLEDHHSNGYHVDAHRVEIRREPAGSRFPAAAQFNGIDSRIQILHRPAFDTGKRNFSIAVWVRGQNEHSDVVGDVISKFDPEARRGFWIGVVSSTGVTTTSQPNYRHVHFGIDNGRMDAKWTDCGRPGQAALIYSLATAGGSLYAGTLELGKGQTGHLWRYAGGERWEDLGPTPDGSNAVPSVSEFKGELYVTTGRYNPNGSCLGDAQNTAPGGRVYRLDVQRNWIDCGHPGSEAAVGDQDAPATNHSETGRADEANSLIVFQGHLYVTSNHRRGVFRYEGGSSWKYVGMDERLITFTVYRDRLYALINGGGVHRYEGGTEWAYCGNPQGCRQVYSAVVYNGELYAGTWPEGEVHRYAGAETWEKVARVGYEREVMAMLLYNAKVYVGTLPMANAWRMDGDRFTFTGNLDNTPTYLRRVWSMSVYQGRLYAGTLPSGHVMSLEAGKLASSDQTLGNGWRHLAAVREETRLKLYVDGRPVATSSTLLSAEYDLSNDQPLRIGHGVGHAFCGAMADLRLYNRALSADEVVALART